jgi:Holliday junction resolvase RusA-like endonuclease
VAYTPARTRGWEALVADVARLAMRGRPPLEGPVELTLRFYRQDRRRCDGDNLTKCLLDAMQGRVFENDDQVVACHWYKLLDRERPRVEVEVREMGNER